MVLFAENYNPKNLGKFLLKMYYSFTSQKAVRASDLKIFGYLSKKKKKKKKWLGRTLFYCWNGIPILSCIHLLAL